MVALDGQPRRHSRGRLHGQPGHRLPLGHRPAQPVRAVQHLLPAWDAITGDAGRHRPAGRRAPPPRTGEGQLVRLALSDVAFAMVGNLGRIAEAQIGDRDQRQGRQLPLRRLRPRLPDPRRAPRDDRRADRCASGAALVEATGSGEAFASIEEATGRDLDDEGGRFAARDLIGAIAPAVVRRAHAGRDPRRRSTAPASPGARTRRSASWSSEDPRCSPENPMFEEVEHPGVGPT